MFWPLGTATYRGAFSDVFLVSQLPVGRKSPSVRIQIFQPLGWKNRGKLKKKHTSQIVRLRDIFFGRFWSFSGLEILKETLLPIALGWFGPLEPLRGQWGWTLCASLRHRAGLWRFGGGWHGPCRSESAKGGLVDGNGKTTQKKWKEIWNNDNEIVSGCFCGFCCSCMKVRTAWTAKCQ